MSNKCPVCNSFMRKEGEGFVCSRCEKEASIGKAMQEGMTMDKTAEIKKTLDESDFATLGGNKLAMGTKDGEFLGYLLGYSIGDRTIPQEIADKKMDELGMPDDIRPSKGGERTTFKNACVLTEREETFSSPTLAKKYGTGAMFRAVYKADQVKPNEYIIDRKIFLVKEKSEKKSDIQFDRLARVTLVIENEGKKNESFSIKAEPMTQGNEKVATYLKDVIEKDWKMLQVSYTSKQVRDALRKFIVVNRGIPFTTGRGGLWFLLASQEENIKRWVEFCQWCDKQAGSDNRVDLRIIPALDIYGMKNNLARDVADEVQSRVKNLLADTYAALKGETAEDDIVALLERQLAAKKENVDGLLSDYKKILKDEINVILQIDVAQQEKIEQNLSPKAKALLHEMMNV